MPIDPNLKDIYVFYGEQIPNYFNRRIFYYASLLDYVTAAGDDHYELKEDVNFNPADGVSTVLDVNSDLGDKFTYLLVVDPEDSSILSRWFIIEADRNLGGQYRLTLRRDVVAESISNNTFATQAPVYVEKGILSDDDPMIVNSEGMSFNQIKRGELRLGQYGIDELDYGAIVGYFEKGAYVSEVTADVGSYASVNLITAAQIATATGLSETKVNAMLSGTQIPFAVSDLFIHYGILIESGSGLSSLRGMKIALSNSALNSTRVVENSPVLSYSERIGTLNVGAIPADSGIANYIAAQTESDVITALNDVIDNDIPSEVLYTNKHLQKLQQFIGSYIAIGGVYYQITGLSYSGESNHSEVQIAQHENTLFDNAVLASVDTEKNGWILYLNYKIQNVSFTLQRDSLSYTTIKTKISSTARTLKDAPYNMFVIPYHDNFVFDVGTPATPISKLAALALASEIAIALGDKLYDIQLLPYMPPIDPFVEYSVLFTPHIDIIDAVTEGYAVEGVEFDLIKKGDNTAIGAIIYCDQSNFSLDIRISNYSTGNRLLAEDEAKIESQCNFYRLCSPNYNGVFEFNLAKNGMSVDGFVANCTYKPIQPFINVQPLFKGLYGSNFKDSRGLILGGDFSLPIIKDAWITYQNNNKNFADIFARDIQNLDVTQKQEAIKEAISLGAGVVGGGGAGAIAGAKYGGMGAVAGAALGTTIGGVGAYIDAALGRERRAEAKDYMIDRFNMNLQNIKAIPQSLARNSSFNIVNKIFPFIEYYSCTDIEKEALRRKIQLDGMSVGRLDYIGNFMSENYQANKYFKGQLVIAFGIEEDTHYINALYEELAKGVYI